MVAKTSSSASATLTPDSKPHSLPSSAAIQDYAKAIYVLAERNTGPVGTSELAARLAVSPASVSAMIKRLSEMGIISHTPYRGVELTERGKRIALEVIRHHRLLELFLHETFDMPWDEVHDEAEVLEHVLSERLEDLIAEKLGNPDFDPHGDPIPARDGTMVDHQHVSLGDLQIGASGQFVRVSDAQPEILRYLTAHNISPRMNFKVTDRQPFDGPLFVHFDGHGAPCVLGLRIAQAMRVVPAGEAAT